MLICNNLIMSFLRNITSKDVELSQKTILNLIQNKEIQNFEELSNSADFIFPFIKERIIKDFLKFIKQEDLNTIFEFSKIYSPDFEDLIVLSWVKFASEDLTDEIIELFENGSNEQKAYCAKYFFHIQDPISLEILNKYAFSDFSYLLSNCAITLKKFNDINAIKYAKETILNSNDDFKNLKMFEYLSAYNTNENTKFILENYKNSQFDFNIIVNLLNFNTLDEIKNIATEEQLIDIFKILIENYPENLSLSTIQYYQILDFSKLISNSSSQYAKNVLLIAKKDFEEYSNNDIYSFDLDKNSKEELKAINNFLKTIVEDFSNLENELESNNNSRFEIALDVIKEFNKVEFSNKIAKLINSNSLNNQNLAKSIEVLKSLNCANLINREIIDNISDENIKQFALSCLK